MRNLRIFESKEFLSSPLLIRYMQMAMIIILSMFVGYGLVCVVLMVMVRSWNGMDSGERSICMGVYNESFKKFSKYYQDRLSSKPNVENIYLHQFL